MKRILVLGLLVWLGYPMQATRLSSPEGYWKTIDDSSGKAKSIVKIWKENGRLKGRIEKLFVEPGEDPDPKCEECTGVRKNQKILGMEFLWRFIPEEGRWVDGKILDPENGKIYHCSLEVLDGGKKLKVFGYIKIIFKIGRSQIWLRTDRSALDS